MPGTTTRTKAWAILLTGFAAALPAQEITWAGLPEMAQSAPAAKALQWQAEAAQDRRGSLGRSFQPRVGVGAFANARATDHAEAWPSASDTRAWPEVQAGVGWNLWRGGRDEAASRAFDASAQAAVLGSTSARADLLLALRRSYLAASLLKRKLEILAEASVQTREDLAKAKKKAGAGFTSHTDVREFELRLLALQKEEADLKDALDQSLADMALITGLPLVELGAVQEGWPEKQGSPGGPGLEERLLASRAETGRWEAQALGRWPLPALDLGLGLIQGGEQGGFLQQQDYRASLGLSVSLWDGGEASAARSALEKDAKALDALAVSAQASRATSSGLAARRMERWLALRPDLEKRVEAASQFRQGVIQEYLKGVRDSRDLEEATKAGEEAKHGLEEARTTAWLLWSEMQHLAAAQEP